MKWLDVMLGEINAKRDAEDNRQQRRATILRTAESVFEKNVRPAVDAVVKRAEKAGVTLEQAALSADEHALLRIRLHPRRSETFHPAPPFWECIADPYNPVLVLRRQEPGAPRPRRSALLQLEEVRQAAVEADLDDFISKLKG